MRYRTDFEKMTEVMWDFVSYGTLYEREGLARFFARTDSIRLRASCTAAAAAVTAFFPMRSASLKPPRKGDLGTIGSDLTANLGKSPNTASSFPVFTPPRPEESSKHITKGRGGSGG